MRPPPRGRWKSILESNISSFHPRSWRNISEAIFRTFLNGPWRNFGTLQRTDALFSNNVRGSTKSRLSSPSENAVVHGMATSTTFSFMGMSSSSLAKDSMLIVASPDDPPTDLKSACTLELSSGHNIFKRTGSATHPWLKTKNFGLLHCTSIIRIGHGQIKFEGVDKTCMRTPMSCVMVPERSGTRRDSGCHIDVSNLRDGS